MDDRRPIPTLADPRHPAGARWRAELGGIRLRFGAGTVGETGEAAAAAGLRRPVLVTDPGVRAAGHADRAHEALVAAGLDVTWFDGVEENPTTVHVARCVEVARAAGVDGFVAVGGGSAMDCAKGANFLLTNGGRLEDYRGRDTARTPLLPAVAVPTTAGTGSDAQSFALIMTEDRSAKMACGDRSARFAEVVLDPGLLASLPRDTAGITGLDAVAHAIESFVSTRATPVSRMLAREAWERLDRGLAASLDGDASARGEILLAAHLAGASIEQSMLGAAHAGANPLTCAAGVVHGVAVAILLPTVVRLNGGVEPDPYAALGGAERVATRIEALRAAAGMPARLRDCGVERAAIPALADDAAAQWTAGFNPRPVGASDLVAVYEAAY